MRRDVVSLYSPAIGGEGNVIAYGHHGRPVLVIPSQEGSAHDYEDRQMIASVGGLIEEGRAKIYCVGSYDAQSWHREDLGLDDRAKQHLRYEDWILNQVVPWIYQDCGGPQDIIVTGASFGAYHAANFTLKRADIFPLALCQSGVYDVSVVGWGDADETVYFNNPMAYVSHLNGDHLDWLRSRAHLVLVCGQGQWEDTTGALESTKRFAAMLAEKQISHELDLWGYDVPHDWPSWRDQIAFHLPRYC